MTVKNMLDSVGPQRVRGLGGLSGLRTRANRENMLKRFDIDRYTRMIEERTHRDWNWREAEQPGKWLESAILSALQGQDEELLEKAREILARIVASQEAGGYVGVTDPEVRSDEQPLRGMDAYELYFLQHALLTAHEKLGESSALECARRLGDYFVAHIGNGKAEFWPSELRWPDNKDQICRGLSAIAGHAPHYGLEGALLVDPMMRLYEATEDGRYLDWCRWVVSRIDVWGGHHAFTKLGEVAAGRLGVNDLQPKVHSHTLNMNLLGFLRLYRSTGDETFLRKVTGAWDDIALHHSFITGGVSVAEYYRLPGDLPPAGDVVETCADMSWIELSQRLLEITGEGGYADVIERVILNHLFASQSWDGQTSRYGTPLNGTKPKGYYHGPDCCTASGHRVMSLLPGLIYGTGGRSVYVNQYIASLAQIELDGNSVSIEQQTQYPAGESIRVLINPANPASFEVCLRMPAWCPEASVWLNGSRAEGKRLRGYFCIGRAWKSGDVIELRLPMKTEWVAGEGRAADRVALCRGPVVYCLDTIWLAENIRAKLGPLPWDLSSAAAIDTSVPPVECDVPDGLVGPGLKVTAVGEEGLRFEAMMVPFANVGVWYRPGFAKPLRESWADAYAVWVHKAGSESFHAAAVKRRESLQPAAMDFEYGETVYENRLASAADIKGWVSEGRLEASFDNGVMQLSADSAGSGNFVLWCPEDFPDGIAVQWLWRPLKDAGLAMFWIAAKGRNGEDLFDPGMAPRDGDCQQYKMSDVDSLHIGWYRNPGEDERLINVRKSYGFHLVAQAADPTVTAEQSPRPYLLEVVKCGPRLRFSIDGRVVVGWIDDGKCYGPILDGGKIGFGQMKGLMAQYSQLKVRRVTLKEQAP